MTKDLALKSKLAFVPLLILGIIFIVGYCSLYWLFCIQLNVIGLKKDLIEFWIPFVLAFALVLIFIRRRLHLLKLDKDNGRLRGLYYLVGAMTLWIPVMIAIGYIDAATGKLTKLPIISDINSKPPSRYYKPGAFVLRKDLIGIEPVSSVSGKYNQYRNFDLYIAIPFIDELYDTLKSPAAYLCKKYHRQISSKIQGAKREKEWSDFWEESFERFEKEPVRFEYLEQYDNSDERDYLIRAAKKTDLYREGNPVTVLKPINEPFDQRTGNKLRNLLLAFAAGLAVWLIMIAIPGLHHHKLKNFKGTRKNEFKDQLNEVIEAIKPRPGFTATPIILAANSIIFIAMVLMGLGFIRFSAADLIPWGALYLPLIQKGEWWRLITGFFLHGGIMHLVMNMISLYLAGIFLEAFIGTRRFLFGYFVTGVLAALVSIWWHNDPIVGVGASGAIFGLYGMLTSLIVSKTMDRLLNRMLLILLACTAGYSLVMGFVMEGVDNSAHVGGLVAGFLLGLMFTTKIKTEEAISQLATKDTERNKVLLDQD